MTKALDIAKKRTAPGILIFDREERLLYCNAEAIDALTGLGKGHGKGAVILSSLPEALVGLVRKMAGTGDHVEGGCIEENVVIIYEAREPHAVRAFAVDLEQEKKAHILVMVERITEMHEPDLKEARCAFDLSKREAEVLKLICNGLGNKSISRELFISEYTVKDHIKSLMRKMNVSSRSEIIARVK